MTYPRETNEPQSATVTVDGVVVTTGVAFAVVTDGARPGTFTAAIVDSGKTCFAVTGLTPGNYRVFAQVTASPWVPVIDCGIFTVT